MSRGICGILVSFAVLCTVTCKELEATSGIIAEASAGSAEDAGKDEKFVDPIDIGQESFLNIKLAHERKNESFWGGQNCSIIGLTPGIRFWDWGILEGGWTYGRQFTYTGWLRSPNYFMKLVGDPAYFDQNASSLTEMGNRCYGDKLKKATCNRSFTRGVINISDMDVRIVVGDTKCSNSIGFQKGIAGGGISVFRQRGDGSTINGGTPIVITSLSKVECRRNGEIIALQIFRPGVYSVEDFPEEAKLPGVKVKITDQLSRSEELSVDYFSGYGMCLKGQDDFDVTYLCPHRWDPDDPCRIKYRSVGLLSTNYRRGISDDLTVGVGYQTRELESCEIDATVIGSGVWGKLSPSVAYSEDSGVRTGGAGVFYATPPLDGLLLVETSVSFTGRGFSDLGQGAAMEESYNSFINRYFSPDTVRTHLRRASSVSSSRQVTLRLSTVPLGEDRISLAFTFCGGWTNSGTGIHTDKKLREYTFSVIGKSFRCFSWCLSAGLTYDDPSKGRNLRSPDRRLTLAGTIDLNSEWQVQGNYVHYDAELRRSYVCGTFTPDAISGLELCAERFSCPGVSNPCVSAKYSNEFFRIKAEQDQQNIYADGGANTNTSHTNRQRFSVGTSVSRSGVRSNRACSANILPGFPTSTRSQK
jgi:hypothetical protein